MPSPDRQQIIDAWETMDWLKSLINPDTGTIQGDKDRLLHAIQDLAEALPERRTLMTNHISDQLREKWEELVRKTSGDYSLEFYNHGLEVLNYVLSEPSKQTMDELGWDQDQNFLWEADYNGAHVAMLGYSLEDHAILTNKGHISPRDLIPTGRRYKLILDDGHPEYLATEQDYKDAPEGTIVADPGAGPMLKIWQRVARTRQRGTDRP